MHISRNVNPMKRIILAAFVFLFAIPAFAQLKGDSWEKVKTSGSGTLTVVYYEQPGLIQDDGNTVKGVCVDLITEFTKWVKETHGKDVKVVYASKEKEFANFLKVIQRTPNILGVTNTSITEERKKIFKFTPPYMSTPLVFLTNDKAPALKSLTDLPRIYAGFTAEVITGSTHVLHAESIRDKYYPELKISHTSSSESVIKNLSTNPKIFSILDFTEYVGVVRKSLPIKRQEVDLGNSEDLAFIMAKQSDWDQLWNEFLTPEYRRSAVFRKIIKENLGSTFLNLVH